MLDTFAISDVTTYCAIKRWFLRSRSKPSLDSGIMLHHHESFYWYDQLPPQCRRSGMISYLRSVAVLVWYDQLPPQCRRSGVV